MIEDVRYTRLANRFWHDEKIETLDTDSAFLFLYLISSPHSNMAGYYRIPKKYIQADLGYDREKVDKSLEILSKMGFILYDEIASVVLILNFLKYNKIQNPNQLKSLIKRLYEIPKNRLLNQFKSVIETYIPPQYKESLEKHLNKLFLKPLPKPFDKPLPKPETVTETVTETETETETVTETEKNIVGQKSPDGVNFKEIIDYLNSKTKSSFKNTTPKTQSLIKTRYSEGFKLNDFKRVIDNKVEEWKNTEFEKFLRPETLFSNKFESYLNQKNKYKKLEDDSLKQWELIKNIITHEKADETAKQIYKENANHFRQMTESGIAFYSDGNVNVKMKFLNAYKKIKLEKEKGAENAN